MGLAGCYQDYLLAERAPEQVQVIRAGAREADQARKCLQDARDKNDWQRCIREAGERLEGQPHLAPLRDLLLRWTMPPISDEEREEHWRALLAYSVEGRGVPALRIDDRGQVIARVRLSTGHVMNARLVPTTESSPGHQRIQVKGAAVLIITGAILLPLGLPLMGGGIWLASDTRDPFGRVGGGIVVGLGAALTLAGGALLISGPLARPQEVRRGYSEPPLPGPLPLDAP